MLFVVTMLCDDEQWRYLRLSYTTMFEYRSHYDDEHDEASTAVPLNGMLQAINA